MFHPRRAKQRLQTNEGVSAFVWRASTKMGCPRKRNRLSRSASAVAYILALCKSEIWAFTRGSSAESWVPRTLAKFLFLIGFGFHKPSRVYSRLQEAETRLGSVVSYACLRHPSTTLLLHDRRA